MRGCPCPATSATLARGPGAGRRAGALRREVGREPGPAHAGGGAKGGRDLAGTRSSGMRIGTTN